METEFLELAEGELKEVLTIQKIYKTEYSFFHKEQECQKCIGYFQNKEDAETFIKIHSKEYKNDEKDLSDKREYFIEEIEVK